ncbi:hypothetical protein Fmac_002825 [Flemingia macrophylla]|uniref:Protein ENHANCED DISEASE RESISTANCE 2 C-terminal domain-containing protein n=1 Tax=Flemingia macrophylla TaxID=520843 RepID=A0ABD1NL12_9FABA
MVRVVSRNFTGKMLLRIDVDIGSSTVANGVVLGLVIGVITTLVVDMAFLVQANTPDELPERLIGAVRVPASTRYSMVFYFVTKELVSGSLLHRFFDGDDEFRNSRFKLIPSVPKGTWIVRQSVGSTPWLLGKAVDCNYIRGPKYLEKKKGLEVDCDSGQGNMVRVVNKNFTGKMLLRVNTAAKVL